GLIADGATNRPGNTVACSALAVNACRSTLHEMDTSMSKDDTVARIKRVSKLEKHGKEFRDWGPSAALFATAGRDTVDETGKDDLDGFIAGCIKDDSFCPGASDVAIWTAEGKL